MRLKLPVPGIDVEQAVNGLGLAAGALAEALRRTTGRRRQRNLDALGAEHLEDRVDQRGLADARTAGDDQDLREQSEPQRCPLALGERDAGPGLDPGHGLRRIDVRPGKHALLKGPETIRDGSFCPIQPGQEDAAAAVDLVRHDLAGLQLQVQRCLNERRRDLQQLLGHGHQFIEGQPAVAIVHGLGQREADAGARPDHGGLLDAQPGRDGVGRLEADAADVAGEPVGVLREHLDGVGAVGLEDAHRRATC